MHRYSCELSSSYVLPLLGTVFTVFRRTRLFAATHHITCMKTCMTCMTYFLVRPLMGATNQRGNNMHFWHILQFLAPNGSWSSKDGLSQNGYSIRLLGGREQGGCCKSRPWDGLRSPAYDPLYMPPCARGSRARVSGLPILALRLKG